MKSFTVTFTDEEAAKLERIAENTLGTYGTLTVAELVEGIAIIHGPGQDEEIHLLHAGVAMSRRALHLRHELEAKGGAA